MPTKIPDPPRAKALRSDDDFRRHELRMRQGSAKRPIETIDWLALWTLSLAFSALFIAGCAYLGEGDAVGASAVLGGTAAIIALALCMTKAPGDSKQR
jgi:hypothetical protein